MSSRTQPAPAFSPTLGMSGGAADALVAVPHRPRGELDLQGVRQAPHLQYCSLHFARKSGFTAPLRGLREGHPHFAVHPPWRHPEHHVRPANLLQGGLHVLSPLVLCFPPPVEERYDRVPLFSPGTNISL